MTQIGISAIFTYDSVSYNTVRCSICYMRHCDISKCSNVLEQKFFIVHFYVFQYSNGKIWNMSDHIRLDLYYFYFQLFIRDIKLTKVILSIWIIDMN